MSIERKRLQLELLEAALDLEPEARGAFLDEQCAGDPELREELERLVLLSEEPFTLGPIQADDLPGSGAAEPAPEARAGQHVGGFELLDLLGEGGMGAVFRALQQSPRREVALKMLRTRSADPRRLQVESEILAHLRHPSIAQVYQAGLERLPNGEELGWFTMELVPGGTPLGAHCRRAGLDLEPRLELFRQACAGIHHGHDHGVIHRDVKSGNLLVDDEGGVKVIDFGIARADNLADRLGALARSRGLAGTLSHMSPEVVRGDSPGGDVRSDVYALGVVLYELVTDRLPFDFSGSQVTESLCSILSDVPPPPAQLVGDCPRDVDAIIRRAMDRDPARRYQSAEALADDVGRFLERRPVAARPAGLPRRSLLWARRRPAVAGLLLVILGVTTGFAVRQMQLLDLYRGMVMQWQESAQSAADQQATLAASRGDFDGLLDALDQLESVESGPLPETYFRRLAAYLARHDTEQAWDQYHVLDLLPEQLVDPDRLTMYQGLLLIADDRLDEGWEALGRASRSDLALPDRLFCQALVADSTDEAEVLLRQAVNLRPTHALAWLALMEAELFGARFAEGLVLARTLQYRFPENPAVHGLAILFASLSGDRVEQQRAVEFAGAWIPDVPEQDLMVIGRTVDELDTLVDSLEGQGVVETLSVILRLGQQLDPFKTACQRLNLSLDRAMLRATRTGHRELVAALGAAVVQDAEASLAALARARRAGDSPLMQMAAAALLINAHRLGLTQDLAEIEQLMRSALPAVGGLPGLSGQARLIAVLLGLERCRLEERFADAEPLLREALGLAWDQGLEEDSLRHLAYVAVELDHGSYAEQFVTLWVEQEGDVLEAHQLRVASLVESQREMAALRALDGLLKREDLSPRDRQAGLESRADVTAFLRDVAETLSRPAEQGLSGGATGTSPELAPISSGQPAADPRGGQ